MWNPGEGFYVAASEAFMGGEEPERYAPKRSRISLGALTEIENALLDYKVAVRGSRVCERWNSGTDGKAIHSRPRKVRRMAEVRVCTRAAAKAADSPEKSNRSLKIERSVPRSSRISFSALAEAEAAFPEYIHEVLQAKLSEWKTNELVDKAGYFMRRLKYDFTPGARKSS